MIRSLIIEDEKIAAESLKMLLAEVEPEIEVVGVLQTVEDSVLFLQSNHDIDLVFADIHLADGSTFSIFERVEVKCPVIFTTAYDEYAIKAFKVNSIDYLLKPIIKDDLQCAIKKFKKKSQIPLTFLVFFVSLQRKSKVLPRSINHIS